MSCTIKSVYIGTQNKMAVVKNQFQTGGRCSAVVVNTGLTVLHFKSRFGSKVKKETYVH